ncbi:hypothetical protein [Deinococcus hopiensis]|uniref:Uncharacterized protein n=1 Tax=Deinococcus hopiensis KR-140 TaxID=695939 RepID=A0A1W1VVW5_9DEIO|nr:hypothetical protein [Deinococcus hopiensis]SMB97251.1 hypothetical protein SAMN00790413_06449 [Deinococcus hopiensis KR-140]
MDMLEGFGQEEREQRERYLARCVRVSLRHRKFQIMGAGVIGVLGAFLAGWGLALALVPGALLIFVSMLFVAIRSRQRHALD